MLGKRSRPSYKRTTSMTSIAVDVGNMEAPTPTPTTLDHQNIVINESKALEGVEEHVMMGQIGHGQRSMAMLSRGAGDDDHTEPAHFLRTCGLCNRGLAPGRDIYMYRGHTAFCSQECREARMEEDERKEKYKLAVSKTAKNHHNHSQMVTAASDASSKSDIIRAA